MEFRLESSADCIVKRTFLFFFYSPIYLKSWINFSLVLEVGNNIVVSIPQVHRKVTALDTDSNYTFCGNQPAARNRTRFLIKILDTGVISSAIVEPSCTVYAFSRLIQLNR